MTDEVPGPTPAEPRPWWSAPAPDSGPTATGPTATGPAGYQPTSGYGAPPFGAGGYRTPGYPDAPTAALPAPDHRERRTRTIGAGLAIAGLLVGGLLGDRVHDAVAGGGTDSTGAVAVPFAPSAAPSLPVVPLPSNPAQPSVPGQSPAAGTGAIAAKVTPSVVDINTTLPQGSGAGTGMVLTTSGDILTNNHVVEGATTIRVVLVSTGKSYPATVVGTDPTEDVAVLRLSGVPDLHPISAADSRSVAIADPVVAIGNAGGRGGAPSVVDGTVTATNRSITVSDSTGASSENLTGLIQTDAPIEPGDSGGPLVNRAAKVIGMNTAASSANGVDGAANEGYAIPINSALTIAHLIEQGRASSKIHIGVPGKLGVSVITPLSGSAGAEVAEVAAGSPAETAGLAVGDVIASVDGHSVVSATSLTTLIRSHRTGDNVRIGWTDGSGGKHTATVKLAMGAPD